MIDAKIVRRLILTAVVAGVAMAVLREITATFAEAIAVPEQIPLAITLLLLAIWGNEKMLSSTFPKGFKGGFFALPVAFQGWALLFQIGVVNAVRHLAYWLIPDEVLMGVLINLASGIWGGWYISEIANKLRAAANRTDT